MVWSAGSTTSPSSSRSRTVIGTLGPGSHPGFPRDADRGRAGSDRRSAMPSATRTITIDRPPDVVFGFLANPANDRSWRPHLKEIAASGPVAAGARIHQVVEGPGGRG